jgi:hypothetical protein
MSPTFFLLFFLLLQVFALPRTTGQQKKARHMPNFLTVILGLLEEQKLNIPNQKASCQPSFHHPKNLHNCFICR